MKKMNFLFLAANPKDQTRLLLGKEFDRIRQNLARQGKRVQIELPLLSARPADISQALLDTRPQIVHFSGHGTSEGALCFENENGESQYVEPEALAALFEQFQNHVNCVVLNACYSQPQAEAIAKHINYVIGMNDAVSDEASLAFSIGFYQALVAGCSVEGGCSVEEAFKLGCAQIRLHGIPEHLTPMISRKKIPMTGEEIEKRFQDRCIVNRAIRLIRKKDYQENGSLGLPERKYVIIGDYFEQQYRTLKQVLTNLGIGGDFEQVENTETEWLAILFDIGKLNQRKLELKPATWKAAFRILSDPRKIGCFAMTGEEKDLFAHRPVDYYTDWDDQRFWYDQIVKHDPPESARDSKLRILTYHLGVNNLCFSGTGLTDSSTSGGLDSRIFFVRNIPLKELNFEIINMGTPNGNLLLA